MKMRMHCSSWRAVAPLLIVLFVLAGLAPTILHKSYNFNTNLLPGVFADGTFGNVEVNVDDQRLEFHRKGTLGAATSAGILYTPYGINWKQDFHIEWSYRLSINNMLSPKQFFMGTALAVDGDFPQTMTGLACGLLRDVGGLWVGVLRFDGGNVTDFDGVPITQKTGTIEIDWDKSMDRMSVKRSGGASANVDGYYAANGALYGTDPMAITQGIVTYNGNFNFTGDNAYIDNLKFDFVKRNFPP